DDLQTHVFVQSVSGGPAKDLLAGTQLAASKGFYGAITSGGDDIQPAWAPDSQAIVLVATTQRNEAAHASVPTHLYLAPVSGGEPSAITSGNDSYQRPTFSPDGKSLFASMERENGKIYSLERAVRFDWPKPGAPKLVATGFDRSVSGLAVSPDS